MILFSFAGFEAMAGEIEKLPFIKKGEFKMSRFADGEMRILLCEAGVKGEECAIVGTISPPDENLAAFAMFSHTLKKEGARSVLAVLPYLAYARADKEKPQESRGAEFVGRVFSASGVDEILTADVHSELSVRAYGIPVTSLDPTPLFAASIKKENISGATIVAPDEGARERAARLMKALGGANASPYVIKKIRTNGDIAISAPSDPVEDVAVIVDDIIDTGKTISLAAKMLAEKGVQRIYVVATHGVFSPRCQLELGNSPVDRIFVTDTIPQIPYMGKRTEVLSCKELFVDHFKKRLSQT